MKGLVKLIAFSCLLLASCDMNSENIMVFSYSYDFSTSAQGWDGDFSDYPGDDSILFELQFKHDVLPESVSKTRKALKLSGNNRNGDLFMFVKKQITGLRANTTYDVLFNIRLASNAPTDVLVPGGSPGESVFIKAGTSTIEPKKVLVNESYKLNINKGSNSTGGADMQVVGTIGIAAGTTQYTEVYRNNNSANAFRITTNNNGEAWVIIGTDSGYKGTTTLYYTSVDVLFNQAN